MLKAKTIAEHFNVSVMLIRGKYHAYRGGNGTGAPVQDVAQACRTDTLWKRVAQALAHESKGANRD